MSRTHERARDRVERKPDPLARFAGANPVFIVSLIGALAYFVARSAQTSFYSKFGLEPEDVGLGHAETLSRAAGGLLALTLVVGAIVLALLRPWRYHPQSERERIGPFARWVSASLIASLVVLALWTPFAYDFEAHDVENGDQVRPPGLSTAYRLITNPLGLRVTKVRVSWIDEMHTAYDFRGEVMYLGRADGTAVFFDPRNKQTVRIPQGDIVIERELPD
jgi:hypothetical protein